MAKNISSLLYIILKLGLDGAIPISIFIIVPLYMLYMCITYVAYNIYILHVYKTHICYMAAHLMIAPGRSWGIL